MDKGKRTSLQSEQSGGVASAGLQERSQQAPPKNGIFPIDLCFCITSPLFPIPTTWRKVQDAVHLTLMISLIFGVLSLVLAVIQVNPCLEGGDDQPNVFVCLTGNIFTIVYAGILVVYCIGVISQYDEDLMLKQKQVRQQKQQLMGVYKDLLSDMDTLLAKGAESAAGLAERSFESKRRDFQRFLERAAKRFGNDRLQNNEVLEQFRRFCMNWMEVFKEASIDPVGRPAIIVTEEEMMRCTTVAELCELCAERLKTHSVAFMSTKREKMAIDMDKNKKKLNQRAGRRLMNIAEPQKTKNNARDDSDDDDDYDESKLNVREGDPVSEKSKMVAKGVGWFECGSVGCGLGKGEAADDGYPVSLLLGCVRLSLLSRAHLQLIVGFLLGLVSIAVLIAASLALIAVFVIISMIGLVFILMRFSDIDIIEQLKREVGTLEVEKKTVEKQKEEMNEFWGDAQKLTDLWRHRTVPRLDLYKEVHVHLEDVPEQDLVKDLRALNKSLEGVEQKLGALKDWRAGGEITEKDKAAFSTSINSILQKPDGSTRGICRALEDVSKGAVMQRLALTNKPH